MKAIYLSLIVVFLMIGFTQAIAQRRTYYQEGKLVDSFHSAVVKYFSPLYDSVFAYDIYSNWSTSKRPCSIFAIKQNKYYKINCLINFYYNDHIYPDSIKITKSVVCSDSVGKAFLATLEKHQIYDLPIDHFKGSCNVYDSSGAFKTGVIIQDGCCDVILYFDHKTVRSVSYDSPKELYRTCKDPKLIPSIELINLFKREWD